MQAKVTKSILDCVHDSPADILPGPAPLPPCQIKLGMFIYIGNKVIKCIEFVLLCVYNN